jgi:hypothetical protein
VRGPVRVRSVGVTAIRLVADSALVAQDSLEMQSLHPVRATV